MVVEVFKTSVSGNGFEVGDMVWAKMRSQPWWPGHVYSEEFATPLVRKLKKDGLLLVALFGGSSYAWFDPSELIPFDSNYAEKSLQTNARPFVRAVEDAVVEVKRRIGFGMCCMCSNKQNFRKIDVQGNDTGDVYSVAAIGKARDSFQPKLALEFLRKLALEPASGEDVDDIDFIKNKATVMSYRKAVFENFDELYDQASAQETSSKAPLSGIEVFADSLGEVKNTAKLKDHDKKDEYIFKRRDVPKEASSFLPVSFKDSTIACGEFALKDATGCLEDTPLTGLGFSDPRLKRSRGIAESLTSSIAEVDQAKVKSTDADDEKRIVQEVEDGKVITQDDFLSPGLDKIAAFKTVVSGPEKVKIPKCPIGELGSGKTITPENKKKQKKEGISLAEMFSAKKTDQSEGRQRSDANYGTDLSPLLGDLHSLAVDPCNAVNGRSCIKGKKAFLRFRSLVFQKSKNFSLPLAGSLATVSKFSEDNVEVPPIKPPSGIKRGSYNGQEEMVVVKKKKVGDITIRKLTDEKNTVNKIDEHPARDVKQPVAMTLKKLEPEPTMLILKFQQGGSLPSFNELKERFTRYGPMDHSATQILGNTLCCQLVFRYKAHAQAAYRYVVGSTSLFGNTDVRCSLKDLGDMDAAEPELPVIVSEDHHLPAMENIPPPMDHAKKDEYLFKPRDECNQDKEKVTSSLLIGELGSGKAIVPEKRKQKKDGISLVEMFSTKKTGPPEGPQRSDGNYGTDLLRVLDDLHSLAVDSFNTVNRGSHIKGKKAFLRFRSLVFQKGQDFSLPLAGGEPNASKSSDDSIKVPPLKPPSGLKRGPPDHLQEEMLAAKKKAGDIRNLTKEKKVTKMIDIPPAHDVKQPVASTLKKPGPELIKKTEQQTPEPTMLTIKFPQGGSLPSYNELKARFVPFGPMDHSGTHIFSNTFSCQVVFKQKAHAQAAYRYAVGSSRLFGNTGVRCILKEVGTMSSAKPEPPVDVPKEHHQQPGMEDRLPSIVPDTSRVQSKPILKKSGGEEGAGKGGRGHVKFMPNGKESQISGASSFSSRLTTDFRGKNFEKAVHASVASPTGSSITTPPSPSMYNGTTLLSPPSLPPRAPCTKQMTPLRVLNRPLSDPLTTPNTDITQQMLSLLTRCKDVVTDVSSILGYTPYHPL